MDGLLLARGDVDAAATAAEADALDPDARAEAEAEAEPRVYGRASGKKGTEGAPGESGMGARS